MNREKFDFVIVYGGDGQRHSMVQVEVDAKQMSWVVGVYEVTVHSSNSTLTSRSLQKPLFSSNHLRTSVETS